jgi:SpoVK/Ycf46/Vps4 family AAA+-type ATPase
LPEQRLTDFIGEFNYLHSMLDVITEPPYDPSMALIRQLVTEFIIFPLGSALVKSRAPTNTKSVLFYGPPGGGKTMVVRAIAHETNSMVFDLSPNATTEVYQGKKEEDKMIASVMLVAKEYQPSLIYIDEVEKVYPAKKKKGKKKKKKKNDPTNPARIKKPLAKWRAKFIDDQTRICIVGCTSAPDDGSKVEFKKNFDKAIYFPYPDYTTLRLLWKTFIEERLQPKNATALTPKVRLKPDFPLSTLAHISIGYSAGSVFTAVSKVLTEERRKNVDNRPMQIAEFIGPLSLTSTSMDTDWESFTVSLVFSLICLEIHVVHNWRRRQDREVQEAHGRRRRRRRQEEKEEEEEVI